jgi:predicted negative regulator of RcsB-dependent stress response
MMKRLLIVLALLVAVVVGLGFYRGWFHVSTGGTDGKSSATFTVDQNQIESDKEKAKEKVRELEQKAKDKTNATTATDKEGAPRP